MEIISFDILDSTQKYLIKELEANRLQAPVAIIAFEQNSGIGSRDNKWFGAKGNFFASISVKLEDLPDDLLLFSASIYFSFIMKETLNKLGENIWLKWPNDLYRDDEKIGGIITKKVNDNLVCGIGINLKNIPNGYRALQNDIEPKVLLHNYLQDLEKFPKWKQIFSKFEIEFELSRKFSVHIENYQKSLVAATLQADGSLTIKGERVYSLR